MTKKHKRITLCLVSSRGGHLYQLYQLRPWWKAYSRFWITGRGADVTHLLKGENVYYGYFPETRSVVNAIKNFFFSLQIIFRQKPDVIVSCGAGIAPPVFIAGKLLGAQLIFIDSISFVKYPSLSAKIISLFADKTLVQHEHMAKTLYGAEYWGSIL